MKRSKTAFLFIAIAAAPIWCAAGQDTVTINGGPTSGVATINVSAGNQNQQINAGSVAQGTTALSGADARQHQGDNSGGGGTRSATATIADGAFAGSHGWTAVNGAAGSDNQQANLATFAFGIEAGTLADLTLSQTRASTEPTGAIARPGAPSDRNVAIGDGAFEGSSGLVQVSLIGGDRNSSANTFALSVAADAGP